MPVEPGQVLIQCELELELNSKDQTEYRSGVGKLLHLMRWSHTDIYNSVRKLSKFMTTEAAEAHKKAMLKVMSYCISTPERGIVLKPSLKWNCDAEFKLVILGRSDSDFSKDPDKKQNVSGTSTFLSATPIMQRRAMQKIVELNATTSNAQDMMYAKRLLESMDLQVKLTMFLEMDNKGAVDIVNNYSVGGRTRHVERKQYYLHELKEQGTIVVKWTHGSVNSSVIFYQSCKDFNKHTAVYVGKYLYMRDS